VPNFVVQADVRAGTDGAALIRDSLVSTTIARTRPGRWGWRFRKDTGGASGSSRSPRSLGWRGRNTVFGLSPGDGRGGADHAGGPGSLSVTTKSVEAGLGQGEDEPLEHRRRAGATAANSRRPVLVPEARRALARGPVRDAGDACDREADLVRRGDLDGAWTCTTASAPMRSSIPRSRRAFVRGTQW